MDISRFSKFAYGVLIYNLLVIMWGALVRATGSGAGCGAHWPLCNGEVVPRTPQVETIIEFTHRLTSGLSMLLIIVLVLWAFRAFPKGHLARYASLAAFAFVMISALIGAWIVLAGLVETNDSRERAVILSVHLVNTFLLLAALFVAGWSGTGERILKIRGHGNISFLLMTAVIGTAFAGMSGAVTSLGDTLFPPGSTAEAIQAGLSPSAHFLIRLRLWHPFIAIAVSLYLIFAASMIADLKVNTVVRKHASVLVALVCIQIGVGFLNVWLKAPITMSLIHLLIADLMWLALVALSLSALSKASLSDPIKESMSINAREVRI